MHTDTAWWQTRDFDYIRIPKELFRNPYYGALSPESKLLYGFLLDRANLSWVQGEKWRTEGGDPFVIFTLSEIQQRLSCGNEKATALLRKLEKHHLIRKDRPKRDGPYHIVVYPFSEDGKTGLPSTENPDSRVLKNLSPESGKPGRNNTDNNKPDKNNTDTIRPNWEYEIKKNIYYDYLCMDYPKDKVDAILEVMVDTLSTSKDNIWIGGVQKEKGWVEEKLLAVDDMRVRYLFDRLKQTTGDIQSFRAFCLARLTEPEAVADDFYTRWVKRDEQKAQRGYS